MSQNKQNEYGQFFFSETQQPTLSGPSQLSKAENDIFRRITKGINFDNFDKIQVEISGRDAPTCIKTFDGAGIHGVVLANVKKVKFEKPTPVQKYSIPIIKAGRDLIACAPTGFGKTVGIVGHFT